MNKTVEVEWYSEICCEICNEVIHNHFNCPCCRCDDAGTSIYGCAYEFPDKAFSCEECGSDFIYKGYGQGCDVIVEITNDKFNEEG